MLDKQDGKLWYRCDHVTKGLGFDLGPFIFWDFDVEAYVKKMAEELRARKKRERAKAKAWEEYYKEQEERVGKRQKRSHDVARRRVLS